MKLTCPRCKKASIEIADDYLRDYYSAFRFVCNCGQEVTVYLETTIDLKPPAPRPIIPEETKG